jgi:cobalt/nickel transport system permease protein
MHICDGVLSWQVLAGGAAIATVGVTLGLRRLDDDDIPKVGVMTAAIFVASLIHVPIGPTSMHLTLIGLSGVLLGWAVFPAALVALFLQVVLFGHGGLTTLGVNVVNFAVPALVCHYLFGHLLPGSARSSRWNSVAGFAAGAIAILLASVLLGCEFWLTGREYLSTGLAAMAAQLPLVVVEGLLAATVLVSLSRVRPGILPSRVLPTLPRAEEAADA